VAANKEDCIICGKAHPRCAAHKNTGDPCMRWPRDEEPVCRLHGGESPQVKRVGAERRAAKAAQADAAAALGYTMDGKVEDPLGAMEGLAAMAIAMTEALAARVNDLTRLRFVADGPGTEQLRSEVALLERSMDRTARMLELVMKHKPDGEAAAAVNLLTSLADAIKGMEDA
jgi:hypothetical protein